MGRKPLSDSRKTGLLQIRLTELERETLDKAAEKESKGTSTWARDTLLRIANRMLSKK
jgi:hypothetical protein